MLNLTVWKDRHHNLALCYCKNSFLDTLGSVLNYGNECSCPYAYMVKTTTQ